MQSLVKLDIFILRSIRRSIGVTRTSKPLPIGRPALNETTKGRLERKRSLHLNDKNNLSSAAKHTKF